MADLSNLAAYVADFDRFAWKYEPATGKLRSPDWEPFAKKFLADFPLCSYCQRDNGDNVPHHCIPFHIAPALELVRHNLLTFCPPCHLYLAHSGNWQDYNKLIRPIVARLQSGIVRHKPK